VHAPKPAARASSFNCCLNWPSYSRELFSLSLSLPSACRKSWEDLTYWRRRPRDSQLVVVVGSERTDEQTTPRDWEKAETALYSSWNAQLSLTPRLEKATERERGFLFCISGSQLLWKKKKKPLKTVYSPLHKFIISRELLFTYMSVCLCVCTVYKL
jgi:hypothetical protein